MEVTFDEIASEDLKFWKKSGNIAVQKKLEKLILAIQKSPYLGIGKPEALKYELAGKWLRRISGEHRIIYKIENDKLLIFFKRSLSIINFRNCSTSFIDQKMIFSLFFR